MWRPKEADSHLQGDGAEEGGDVSADEQRHWQNTLQR